MEMTGNTFPPDERRQADACAAAGASLFQDKRLQRAVLTPAFQSNRYFAINARWHS
jgi:hypothetical protein